MPRTRIDVEAIRAADQARSLPRPPAISESPERMTMAEAEHVAALRDKIERQYAERGRPAPAVNDHDMEQLAGAADVFALMKRGVVGMARLDRARKVVTLEVPADIDVAGVASAVSDLVRALGAYRSAMGGRPLILGEIEVIEREG